MPMENAIIITLRLFEMENEEIRKKVREGYAEIAKREEPCCVSDNTKNVVICEKALI